MKQPGKLCSVLFSEQGVAVPVYKLICEQEGAKHYGQAGTED